MKRMTLGDAETKRLKAVDFLHRIGNDADAERFEAMDAREYAEHKGAELIENPRKGNGTMPRAKSKAALEDELDDANDYIEELESKLNDIVGIAADDEDDSDESSESDEDDSDED